MRHTASFLAGIVVIATLLAAGQTVQAQALLGDGKSESSLILDRGGHLSVNMTDKKAQVAYVHDLTGRWNFGFDLFGRVANKVATLFDGENISPEAGFNFTLGVKGPLGPDIDETSEEDIQDEGKWKGTVRSDWIYVRVGYKRGSYNLFDGDRPFEDQLYTRHADLPSLGLFYNVLIGTPMLGISVHYERANNYENLARISSVEYTIIGSDGSTRILEEEISARSGDFEEFDLFAVNIDFMWVPDATRGRLGVDIFLRVKDGGDFNSVTEPGLGFFLLEDGQPNRIVAGLTGKLKDPDNKIVLGLVVGYNF